MIEIFDNQHLPPEFSITALEGFIHSVVSYLGMSKTVGFSLSLVDRLEIQTLNREYRNKDKATDVLTFCLNEGDDQAFPDFDYSESGESPSLGDIIICLDIVQEHANLFNVSVEEELRRVIVHGILHLLGKNHTTNDANEPMLIEQEYILKELNGLSLLVK